jgi:hypothetical protein
MSYHLTILRTAGTELVPIALDEAIAATSSLGDWQYLPSPPAFEHAGAEGATVIWHQDGQLWTSNPEPWSLAPMLELARRLDARVRGDEFETYETFDRTFLHPDDVIFRQQALVQSKALRSASLRGQKLIRNAIIACFLGLGVLAFAVGKWLELHLA